MPLFRKKRRPENLPSLDMPRLRDRIRILVVDDEPDAFPTKLFQDEGYHIEEWTDVRNLSRLEDGSFDLIILDIQGVGQSYSPDEGLGIIRHLKKAAPHVVVVAFSGQTDVHAKKEFWTLADDSFSKSASVIEIKRSIDDLIQTRFQPDHLWDQTEQYLKQHRVADSTIKNIASEIDRQRESNGQVDVDAIVNNYLKYANTAVVTITLLRRLAALAGWSVP